MIVLVGFMGAGKTTVGRLLADQLGLPFLDSDQVIEAAGAHARSRQIFADDGEPAFRELEHEVVAGLLTGRTRCSPSAAAPRSTPAPATLLAPHVPVVYLRVGYAEALARVAGTPTARCWPAPTSTSCYAAPPGGLRGCGDDDRRRGRPPPEEIALDLLASLDGPLERLTSASRSSLIDPPRPESCRGESARIPTW